MLYLRARWYSPGEGVFLSRDPIESEPPYTYVRGNPVHWIDPSGMDPPPPTGPAAPIPYNEGTPNPPTSPVSPQPIGTPVPDPPATPRPQLLCPFGTAYDVCPPNPCPLTIDQFSAGGYAEGWSGTAGFLFSIGWQEGGEIAYDFATMERARYTFKGVPPKSLEDDAIFKGITTNLVQIIAGSWYGVHLNGFENKKSLNQEYSGVSYTITIGGSTPYGEIGHGSMYVYAEEVTGWGSFGLLGVGYSPISIVNASWSPTEYTIFEPESGGIPFKYERTRRGVDQMKNDILTGAYTPPNDANAGNFLHTMIVRRVQAVIID